MSYSDRDKTGKHLIYLLMLVIIRTIDCVKEATFLGVILVEHLTWKSHIHNVARKVSKAIGIIHKSSFCVNNSSLWILYFSLIYTYLFFCVWASTYPSNLRRLFTPQKRVITNGEESFRCSY